MRLIVERVAAFARNIRHMPAAQAHRHLSALVELIAAAFGEEIGLSGSRSAIAREIAFSSARCFVQANLADSDLTPERVLESLGLSRPTMYRLFQHEGGLGAYIRHMRLRTAANDIVRFPGIAVKDVAYSVGFKSASDFTRAFRRAFGVTPQDLREYEGWHTANIGQAD
ncbi:helix-turn-helix transcriptional regulator [Cupriavidus sp. D39]|uniref:helix-turn-helix transcriptional regulator n=1 Tax=Cupriavidus sp. D39 TaxID=2997877 RepID=UPI002271BF1E|nr:helix-turn-helix transcriptional regulator [Cupriavidus sp. D39]MCY0854914.1 helix-turn-helix transcriptional regulator [Cupriavidus sp. D39]